MGKISFIDNQLIDNQLIDNQLIDNQFIDRTAPAKVQNDSN